jgi:hypothetical protein
MGATGTYGFPYQELGEVPNGAALGQDLAVAIDTELQRIDGDIAGNKLGQVIARADRITTSTSAASTTDVGVLRLDDVPVSSGRAYQIRYRCNPNSSISTDIIGSQLRYTTDGSTPAVSSTVLAGSTSLSPDGTGTITQETTYTPGSNLNLSLLLCVNRTAGTGNCNLFADGARATSIWIVDGGVDPGDSGTDV